jgi:hypothetical protein
MDTRIQSLGKSQFESPLRHFGAVEVPFKMDADRILVDHSCSSSLLQMNGQLLTPLGATFGGDEFLQPGIDLGIGQCPPAQQDILPQRLGVRALIPVWIFRNHGAAFDVSFAHSITEQHPLRLAWSRSVVAFFSMAFGKAQKLAQKSVVLQRQLLHGLASLVKKEQWNVWKRPSSIERGGVKLNAAKR